MTIQSLTKKSNKILKDTSTTSSLDSVVFLCEVLHRTKEFIFANPNFEISKEQERKFFEMIERRKNHEPVAYIINKKEFFGLDFYVDKNVLIPRPETEMFIHDLIHKLNHELNHDFNIDIIDIGTGSGCIIVSIIKSLIKNKTELKSFNFFAIDNSEKSLEVARKNFKLHRIDFIKTLQGNLLEPYLKIRNKKNKAIIIANLPYLNDDEYNNTAPDVKKFEPKSALYGGGNGLKFIKELLTQVSKNGLNKAIIMLEISPTQTQYFIEHFPTAKIIKDLFGVDRIAILTI